MEQYKEGDECLLTGPNGHFLKPVFENSEWYIAYWYSGSGIPSGLSLCEYFLESEFDPDIILFGSNKFMDDVIYHDRIKKVVENSEGHTKFVCTVTRQKEVELPPSQKGAITYRTGRFWSDKNPLQDYKGPYWVKYHHAICDSSSFINGTTKSRKDNKIVKGICENEECRKEFAHIRDKMGHPIRTCDSCGGVVELFRGIRDHLIDAGVDERCIEIDQFYLH